MPLTKKEKREIRYIEQSERKKHPSYSEKRVKRIANAVVYSRKRKLEKQLEEM